MVEWKKSSKLTRAVDAVADFVASFARIPADLRPEEWINSLEGSEHPGRRLSRMSAASATPSRALPTAARATPRALRLGSPQWIRGCHKPGAPDLYGSRQDRTNCPPSPTSHRQRRDDAGPLPQGRVPGRPCDGPSRTAVAGERGPARGREPRGKRDPPPHAAGWEAPSRPAEEREAAVHDPRPAWPSP